jgi:hypothetical protein
VLGLNRNQIIEPERRWRSQEVSDCGHRVTVRPVIEPVVVSETVGPVAAAENDRTKTIVARVHVRTEMK